MTEYEEATLALEAAEGIRSQVALVQAQAQILNDAFATYMTVLSGYLAVAYFVGAHLTRAQTTILNVLYLLFVSGSAFSMSTAHGAGALHYQQVLELDPARTPLPFWADSTQVFGAVVLVVTVAASLYFMWSVRRDSESRARAA